MKIEKLRRDVNTPAVLSIYSSPLIDGTCSGRLDITLLTVLLACCVLLPFYSLPAQKLPADDDVLKILEGRLDEGRSFFII